MGLGGFTAAAAKVVLGVEGEQFSAGVRRAQTEFTGFTVGMKTELTQLQEQQLRASAAWDKYASAIRRSGPASREAKLALAGLSAEQRRLTMAQEEGLAINSRFERGMIAGSGAAQGMGRALAFASNAFLGGAGLVYAIKTAVDASQRFHGEMELLRTQALATQGEVNRMTGAVLRLAPALGTSPDQLAKGLYHVESAGIRGARALQILTTAAQGARVGHADLEAVTNALVAAQKSGIRGVQNMQQAMGALDAIIGTGNMRMEDLAAALSTGVLPAARNFGLGLHDVGAALAVMTDAGVPANEAATRLRMTFALLGAQTPVAAKELQQIGISTDELGRTMREKGLIPALELLKTRLKESGRDATQQAHIIVRAFGGGRQSATLITLLQQLDNVRMKFKMISEASGQFASRWHAEQQQAEFAFARLGATLDVLKVRIGNALLPTVVSMTKALTDWLAKSSNQARIQRDVNNVLHDAVVVGKLFGEAMHDVGIVLHDLDSVLGGSGRSLKLLLEYMLASKVIAFGRALEVGVVTRLRAVQAAARDAAYSIVALGTASDETATATSGTLVPAMNAGATAMRTEASAAAEAGAAVGASGDVNVIGKQAALASNAYTAARVANSERIAGMVAGPNNLSGGLQLVSRGKFAGTVRPAMFGPGGVGVLARGSSIPLSVGERIGLAGSNALRMLPGFIGAHGVGIGLAGTLAGSMIGGRYGGALQDTGMGLMIGTLARVPLAGLGVGLGMGAKKLIGGQAGSYVGNALMGAGVGAQIGTMIAPGVGTAIGAAIGGAGGLVASLVMFGSHTKSAAEKLTELATASQAAAHGVAGARAGYQSAIHNVHADQVTVDQTKQALKEAQARYKAAKGADAQRIALDELRVAQDNYRVATQNLQTDLGKLGDAHDNLRKKEQDVRDSQAKLLDQFQKLGTDAQNEGPKVEGFGRAATLHWPDASEKLQDYISKMNKLGDSLQSSDPKLASVAHKLALIAQQAGKIPNSKTIKVALDYAVNIAVNEIVIRHGKRLSVNPNSVEGEKHSALTSGITATDRSGATEAQAAAYDAQRRAQDAAAKRSRAYARTHPPFQTTLSPNITEQELNAQLSGSKSALLAAYKAEVAFWQDDVKRAVNQEQRIAAKQQLVQAESQLSSLETKTASSVRKNAGSPIPGYGPYLDRILKAQQTVKNKKDDVTALTAAEHFLTHYLGGKSLTEKERVTADRQLKTVKTELAAAEKKAGGRSGGTGTSFLKALTPKQRATYFGLAGATLAAEATKYTISDDIATMTAEKKWLTGFIANHPLSTKAGFEAQKILTKIDLKLAKLLVTSNLQLRALEKTFLDMQASFFASFGSNDFTTDANGHRTMGSPGVRTVIVNQDLRSSATPDRHREARLARFAIGAAFAS